VRRKRLLECGRRQSRARSDEDVAPGNAWITKLCGAGMWRHECESSANANANEIFE
jgi:hypothetical protein